MSAETHSGLLRAIRRWDLVALVINAVIGAGIFGLPSKVFGLVGTYSLLAFVLCAGLATLLILCVAELGGRFARTGGPYVYARAAFGEAAGFEVGWLIWLVRVTSFASLSHLLVDYLAVFWPQVSIGTGRLLVLGVIAVAMATVNIIGVRQAAVVSNLFTIGKLAPLALLIVVGLFFVNPSNFSFATPPTYASISKSLILLVFAFSGFESAVIPAGESVEPRRDMPFALLTAIGVITLFYILIQVVCIGVLPGLAMSDRPLADAASRFLGGTDAGIITLGAIVSISGTLNAIMLAAPRLLYAMSEDSVLPRVFARTHSRFRTPVVAIVVTAALMFAFAANTSFISALTISTIARLIAYAATCAAVPILRRRDPISAGFRAPAGGVVSIAAVGLCIWLVTSSSWNEAMVVAIAGIVGLAVYSLRKRLDYQLKDE